MAYFNILKSSFHDQVRSEHRERFPFFNTNQRLVILGQGAVSATVQAVCRPISRHEIRVKTVPATLKQAGNYSLDADQLVPQQQGVSLVYVPENVLFNLLASGEPFARSSCEKTSLLLDPKQVLMPAPPAALIA